MGRFVYPSPLFIYIFIYSIIYIYQYDLMNIYFYFRLLYNATLFFLLLKCFHLWLLGAFAWHLCSSDIPLSLLIWVSFSTSLLSGSKRSSRLILNISWSSTRINHFSKEPCFCCCCCFLFVCFY